ncbi:MAG: pyridoxine 5'-phosphate synthase [Ignavibacteriales bacterium]|nr:pyridoxine 5'-phosphate synthase [Ignavibacteriales bacterium]
MRLAINIDHLATLRNARGGTEPSLVQAVRICETAGARGIVCHLREDRRHIRDADVRELRKTITTKLDLEMAATGDIIGVALEVVPDFVTLVPERRQELTTEDGLDVVAGKKHLLDVIRTFHDHKIKVSLFVNPIVEQIRAAREIGTDMIEIHTGEYSEAHTPREQEVCLAQVKESASLAKSLGLGVHAGHGLNYVNVGAIAAIPEIDELSIGFAVIVRSMFVGLESAVQEMRSLVEAS